MMPSTTMPSTNHCQNVSLGRIVILTGNAFWQPPRCAIADRIINATGSTTPTRQAWLGRFLVISFCFVRHLLSTTLVNSDSKGTTWQMKYVSRKVLLIQAPIVAYSISSVARWSVWWWLWRCRQKYSSESLLSKSHENDTPPDHKPSDWSDNPMVWQNLQMLPSWWQK